MQQILTFCVYSLSSIISKQTAITILLKHVESRKYLSRDKGEFPELEPIFDKASMAMHFASCQLFAPVKSEAFSLEPELLIRSLGDQFIIIFRSSVMLRCVQFFPFKHFQSDSIMNAVLWDSCSDFVYFMALGISNFQIQFLNRLKSIKILILYTLSPSPNLRLQ